MGLNTATVAPLHVAALFLDTNVLRRSRFLLDDAEAQEFLRLADNFRALVAVPEIVFLEYVDYLEQRIRELRSKGTQSAEELRRLGVSATFEAESEEALGAHVTKRLTSELERLHVLVCACADVPVRELMEAAVRKVPPFRKDDRGFRDALIVEACRSKVRSIKTQMAVLITGDEVFAAPQIAQRFSEAGVPLKIATNLSQAIEVLNSVVKDVVAQYVQERNDAAKAFLEQAAASIREFAASKATVTRWALFGIERKLDATAEKVKCVEALVPGQIQSVTAAEREESARVKITCYLSCSVSLLVERTNVRSLLFEEVPIGQKPEETWKPMRTDMLVRTIDAQVRVDAEATEKERGMFSDLELLSASFVG